MFEASLRLSRTLESERSPFDGQQMKVKIGSRKTTICKADAKSRGGRETGQECSGKAGASNGLSEEGLAANCL